MTKAKGKDFSNPHKMGFMRVLMVYYAISLLLMMAGLCLVPGQEIAYNWETARTTTSLIIDVIGLWLLSNRMRAARGFSIVVYAANVALSVTLAVISPTDFSSLVLAVVPDLAIVAYFVFSRRVKAVLIAPFSLEPKRDAPLPKPNELVFWRNLIMYYCIFALVGHWMEAGFGMLIRWGIVSGTYTPSDYSLWEEWFYPFPTEGFGFVMCVVLLYPARRWLQAHIHDRITPFVLSFLLNSFVCGAIEFFLGLVVNAQLQLWDYSDLPFNIMGQVCLQNSLCFGVISTAIVWIVYPLIERVVGRTSKDVMNVIFVGIVAFYALLQCLYMINIVMPATAV